MRTTHDRASQDHLQQILHAANMIIKREKIQGIEREKKEKREKEMNFKNQRNHEQYRSSCGDAAQVSL